MAGARPTLSDIGAAVGTLTILPFDRPDPHGQRFARASLFFPVWGLLFGGGLATIDRLLASHVPAGLLAVFLVVAWETLSGFGALRVWSVNRRRGALGRWVGAILIVMLLCLKACALGLAAQARTAALLFAPTLGRWAMVVLATGARSAAAPNQKFNTAITFREFALTSVFTFAALFALTEATGVLVAVCAGTLTLGVRLLLHRSAGGVSWDWLLACCALVETVVVLLFATLAR